MGNSVATMGNSVANFFGMRGSFLIISNNSIFLVVRFVVEYLSPIIGGLKIDFNHGVLMDGFVGWDQANSPSR